MQSISSAKALRCSSSKDTSLTSSAVMLSGMYVHDFIMLVALQMPGTFSLIV